MPVILGALGAIGACVGSFLNVVAYRLPRACMSVVRPASRCPRCQTPIAAYDNVPVLAWFWLRGKCRRCRLPISFRYPAVEMFTAGLFVLVALWTVGPLGRDAFLSPRAGQAWIEWGVGALVTGGLLALSLIDFDHYILPDEITKTGIFIGPLLAFAAPRFQHGSPFVRILDSAHEWAPRVNALASGIAGAAVASALLYGVGWLGSKIFKKEAMGFGDVKMIAAMGGLLGLWALLALAVASILGAVIGLSARGFQRNRYIPFGPFLAAGMWLVMWFGPELLHGWLTLFARGRA